MQMGTVIPFKPRALAPAHGVPPHHVPTTTCSTEQAVLAAVDDGCDRRGVLAAAGPLIEHCRDHFGFTVMGDGLPSEPGELADALITLRRGLAELDAEFGGRPFWTFGVYFGHQRLNWFEDGYGGRNALAVPNDIAPAAFADFVRPRVQALRG
jgi:hypothetical protein